jgi:hypothetical protein
MNYCARMPRRRSPGASNMIEMRRAQRSFGDGLIAEEVGDRREDWMRHADLSTPEQKCIGWPERKYISDASQKAPETGVFCLCIRLGSDYLPAYPSSHGVSGACSD